MFKNSSSEFCSFSYFFCKVYRKNLNIVLTCCKFPIREDWIRRETHDRLLFGSHETFPTIWIDKTRGWPFANAANSYVEFPACISQKFGHLANIRHLLEKAKKFTICIGNSAPVRTFFLKILEKFDYRFLRKQKLFIGPFWVTRLKISRVFISFMWNNLGGRSALPRIFL